ncbi:MAG: hypothetical protein ABL965_07770 [Nitrospira sp.]|jgi:hypothetical protein|nr:MAG: hypothetical protein E8D44_04310 [Nitrospira sp.]
MNLSSLTFWANLFGWSAVTLTALAAAAGSLAWYFTVQRDAVKDELEMRFKQESSAKISAADLQAAEANRKADEARLETMEVSKEAALANERARKLEVDAATQRKLTAEAELKLAEIKKRQGPRSLPRFKMLAVLREVPPGKVRILYQQIPESIRLAEGLQETFMLAQWSILEFRGVPTLPDKYASLSDVHFVMRDLEGVLAQMNSIKKALALAGLSWSGGRDETATDDIPLLIVMPKY